MFDIRVFNALATQTSIKIGQISFNVTMPVCLLVAHLGIRRMSDLTVGIGGRADDARTCSDFLHLTQHRH